MSHRSLLRLRPLTGRCLVVLGLYLVSAPAYGAASHPLDPLSAEEFAAAVGALRAHPGFPAGGRFALLTLAEPRKERVLAHRPGDPVERAVFAVVYDRAGNRTYEGVTEVSDLAAPAVRSWREVEGVQPMVIAEEGEALEEIVEADARVQAAYARRGYPADRVHVDYWAAGTVPERFRGRRLLRALFYYRGDAANFYGQPIEGLGALVDVNAREVLEFDDAATPPPLPPPAQDLDEESIRKSLGALRTAPKPLLITQPEGASFTLRGNEIEWQKWRFRVLVHPREGAVLYQVGYDEAPGQSPGRTRSILYRASFSEMAVPYGDPERGWNWRCAFDVGEYGVGRNSYTLTPGLEVPANAFLLDALFADERGDPEVVEDALAVYERDGGLLWKHLELGGEEPHNEARRARELVVSSIATVGNYDYAIDWIFRQDGSLAVEAVLSGIMLPKGVAAETRHHDGSGHLVSRSVVAPHHQHILNFRLDFDVDGAANSVTEMKTAALPPGPGNPAGTGLLMEESVLASEQAARRDLSLADARAWRVINPALTTALGDHPGYILQPGSNSVAYAWPDSLASRRAGFMRHHFWATRYRPEEMYAAGDYPNQSAGGDGLPRYTADDEPLSASDLVVWYTMTVTHVPRPEEWPVMPSAHHGFRLLPAGFFPANPALDVPK